MPTLRQCVFAASLSLLTAAPAQAVVPAGNLIANPGAEADAGSTDGGCGGDLDVSSWDPETETFSAVQYGTGGFPSLADSAKIGGGSNLFTGGCPAGTASTGDQTVAVPDSAPEIDAGQVTATLSGYLGGFSTQEDNAMVEVFFLGEGGTDLGNAGADLVIGPVTAADRANVTDLLFRTANAGLPAGTRSILTRLTLTRLAGSANDGYADNLSLTLAGTGSGPGTSPSPGVRGTPPPVLGAAVNGETVRGVVLVRVPGGRFVPLEELSQVPVGSVFDTRRGTVRLISARDSAGNTQSGDFSGGVFKVVQSRRRADRGITELRLTGSSFKRCGKTRAGRSGAARAALSRTIRRLRANAKGRFRTSGRNAAATVRGTAWEMIDRCDGTLTRVKRGSVSVRDFSRRKTVIVRAGKSYLARARAR